MSEIEKKYQETLDYLYSFVDFSLTRNLRNAEEKFDLDRMRALAERLGHPQQAYPIIHIAGTKGKGSIAALCAGALQAAGYRVGLYTSPHLVDYTERIQVNRQSIPQADLAALVEELKPHIQAIPNLTTFEITTALAFVYFQRLGVTAAVFEVGLGGRLDATNIVTPVVSVLASISYDHMAVLGNTLALIAREKAGIVKPGIPVVSTVQKEEARQVIEQIALERGAPLIQVGRDILFERLDGSLDAGQTLEIWCAGDAFSAPEPSSRARLSIPLLGAHQAENAAAAYAALQVFRSAGYLVDEAAIAKGFAGAQWPGRFEVLQRQPPIVLDCAHNRDSALRLRQTLDEQFPDRPIILVFGASEDKDVDGMFAELMPRVSRLIATKSYHPRAMDIAELEGLEVRYGKSASITSDVEEAFKDALETVSSNELILVTGSIFVVAGARQMWLARHP